LLKAEEKFQLLDKILLQLVLIHSQTIKKRSHLCLTNIHLNKF